MSIVPLSSEHIPRRGVPECNGVWKGNAPLFIQIVYHFQVCLDGHIEALSSLNLGNFLACR